MASGNLGGTRWGFAHTGPFPGTIPFEKGNKYAAASNMTPDAHHRRMQALYRGWATMARRHRGERVMSASHKENIRKAKRTRLRENLQAEARDIQNLARTYAVAAMEKLHEISEHSEQDSAKIAAIQVILERAYGKATQTSINANLDANGKPTEVTSKELDTRIAETLKRVENLTGGTAQEVEGEGQPADLRVGDRDTGGSSIH